MEVSPRAGGNRLAEMLNYAADVDIIEAEVTKAVDVTVLEIHEPNYRGSFAIYVLHSDRGGFFNGISIDPRLDSAHIIEKDIHVHLGSRVYAFSGVNQFLEPYS